MVLECCGQSPDVEKGRATNTHSEQGNFCWSWVVMMPAICGHLSHCEAKQPIRA
jgi:hypothetical protein